MTRTTSLKQTLLRTLALTLILLVAAFGFAGLRGDSPAFAASKVKLTKTKITLQPGATVKLSVKNAHQKVRWQTASKKRVAIKKKSGKYRQTVVLKAGKKTGSCWIKAKVGKKTLKCKVTVKKAKTPAPVPKPPQPEVLELSDTSVDLAAGFPFAAPADTAVTDGFTAAYTDFSFRLLQATLREDPASPNVLVSPDSVMTALAMTAGGAAGTTQQQMLATLTGTGGSSESGEAGENGESGENDVAGGSGESGEAGENDAADKNDAASGAALLMDALNESLWKLHARLSSGQDFIYTNNNSIWAKKNSEFTADPQFLQLNKHYLNASFFEAP
ncbi:MAG: hypothetical protein IJ109_10615, partial [Firmicutes bacterium]|nr:hypothetical protein [Bacillota bacterium]